MRLEMANWFGCRRTGVPVSWRGGFVREGERGG